MVLFVNACVRKESRTRQLAERLLGEITEDYEEIKLENIKFSKVDEEFLKNRDRLIADKKYDDESFAMARQFARANTIVIAAPYWDLSFPSIRGLCKAKKLYYVMTAGGNYVPEEFGFGYVKALAQNFYGIKNVELIKKTGLDIKM